MTGVSLSATMDTSGLSRALPLAVLAGKRTVEEQAVTSLGWIFVNAQKATPKVEISTIHSELNEIVPMKRKFRHESTRKFVDQNNLGGLPWTKGMMIALQRTNPASPFSVATGNRWPLRYAGGLKGQVRWRFFQQAAERMEKTRNSATAFLKSGYSAAIKKCFASPLFRHSRKYRSASSALRDQSNQLNSLNSDKLGAFEIVGAGSDHITVTGENNVGEKSGNSIMDAKHRNALILKSAPHLQAAIYQEQANLTERGELGQRMADALRPVQQLLD